MPRSSYHHGDLRSAAIRKGVAIADAEGLDSVVAREIAREVGVSPAAVFRHFPDLEHLKAEVSRAAREELGRQMLVDLESLPETPLTPQSAIARFETIGRRYITFAIENAHLFEAAFRMCGASPTEPDDPSPWHVLLHTVDDLVATGVIAPADRETAPVVAWTTVHGMATLQIQGLEHVSGFSGEPADLVIDVLRRALYVREGGSAR